MLAACGTSLPPTAPPTAVPQPSGAQPAASTSTSTLTSTSTSTSVPASAPTTAATPGSAVQRTQSASQPTASAGAPPRAGGQLRSGQIGDIVTLDPHFLQPSSESVWLSYDRLTAYDQNLEPQPMLAESWELSSDAKQLKLNLRHGVQFHTGREFTSDDVNYSVTRAKDPKVGVGQYATQASWFQSIQTPDKYTAILVSDQPRPLVFDFLENLNMVDKDTLEGPDAKVKSIGTGPFVFTEWAQGDHATYVKNMNYWESGKPYLDEIRVVMLQDAQAMMVQLESSALDIVRNPLRQDFARLRSDPTFQAVTHPANSSANVIGAACYAPPTDHKLVRQALNYAIDRKRIVDTLLLGVGTPESLPWSEGSPAYDAQKAAQYAFDLDKASDLLAQANVSNLTVDIIPNPGNPEGADLAQLYQADLATIGVTLNIIKLEMAVWSDQVNGRKYNGLYYASSANLQLEPGTAYTGRPLNPGDNNEGFSSDTYNSLVAASLTETDPAKLKQIYSQINDVILDESFIMYLTPNPVTLIARTGVHDMTPNLHGGWQFTDAWLDA